MAPSALRTSGDYIPLVHQNADSRIDGKDLEYDRAQPIRGNLWQRLGRTNLLTLLLGSAVLPLVLLLLGLMWKESMTASTGGEPKKPWIQIFDANWTASVVTICAAIMRTVMALQAGLTAAMLAAVILETVSAPLLEGPFYSIIRAFNVAPINMLPTTNFRPRSLLSFTVHTLIIIEVLMTIASQFISTIFLSDFADGTFASLANSTDIRTLGTYDLSTSGSWTTPSASSWAFAELSESFTNGKNFHDTGHTYRSFLPFEDEALRTTLRTFYGPAPVIDQRVVCANPSLVDLTLDSVSMAMVRLSGRVSIDTASYSMLHETETQHYINFTCALPIPATPSKTEGETSLCFANGGTDWTVLLEDPFPDPTYRDGGEVPWNVTGAEGVPNASTMYMILDVISVDAIRQGLGAKHAVEMARNDGPWAVLTNGANAEALRITACMTNLGLRTFTADMKRSWSGVEPKISWDHQTRRYDTDAIRRQLGPTMTPQNLAKRGVLSLEPKSQWRDFTIEKHGEDESIWFFSQNLAYGMPTPQEATSRAFEEVAANPGVILSTSSQEDNACAMHVDLFQDTLRATGSPALATQALLTRMCQMLYYESLIQQDTKAAASTTFSSTTLIPVKWTGFTAVTALIATHLILLWVVTVLFLKYAHNSLLGNYWQAVSQVVSEDTLPILEQADRMKDQDIRRWANRQQLDIRSYGILRSRSDGRIAFSAGGNNM